MRYLKPIVGAVVLSLIVTACGGVSHSSSSTTSIASSSSATTGASSTTSTTSGRSAVTAGPLHAVLHGANHAPKLGRPWSYSVTVTDAVGHPLSGTVDIEFTFGGQVVGHDTPPTHPVRNGTWHDTLTFPAAAVGQQLMFRAVVHASLGSVTLDWPIVVQR